MVLRIMVSRHSAFYTPLISTIAAGFLDDCRLTAEYSVLTKGQRSSVLIRSGAVDIMQSAVSSTWNAIADAESLAPVHFAQINRRDGFFLVRRKIDGPFRWTDLEGRTLLADHGLQPLVMLKYAARENGVEWTRIQVIDAGTPDEMVRAYRAGKGDYVHLQSPAGHELEHMGIGSIAVSVGKSMPAVAFSSLCCPRKFLETDACRSFLEAFGQAREWSREAHPEEVARKISPFFPDVKLATLTVSIQAYQRLGCWDGGVEIPRDLYEQAAKIFELIQGTERFPYDSVCDESLARRAIKGVRAPVSVRAVRSPYIQNQTAIERPPSPGLFENPAEGPQPIHPVSLGRVAGAAIGVFGSFLAGALNPVLPVESTTTSISAPEKSPTAAPYPSAYSAISGYVVPSADQANVNLADVVVECAGRIQWALMGQIDPELLSQFEGQRFKFVAMSLAAVATMDVATVGFGIQIGVKRPDRLLSREEADDLLKQLRPVDMSLESSIHYGDYVLVRQKKAEYARILIDAGWTQSQAESAADAAIGQILSTMADHVSPPSRPERVVLPRQISECDFFISHASSDRVMAESLYDLLRPHARVFLDTRALQPGVNWTLMIVEAIDAARVVVFLISARSQDAYFQQEEVLRAVDNGRADASLRLIPVFLDNIDQNLRLPLGLASRQAIRLSKTNGMEGVAKQLLDLVPPGGWFDPQGDTKRIPF